LRTLGFDGFLPTMNAQLQFCFLIVAGLVNRQQQAIIEYQGGWWWRNGDLPRSLSE